MFIPLASFNRVQNSGITVVIISYIYLCLLFDYSVIDIYIYTEHLNSVCVYGVQRSKLVCSVNSGVK